ncbi:MAG: tRNA guanosine(34) transglycosylase Tgt, partial [Patescibacteria group bacterium]
MIFSTRVQNKLGRSGEFATRAGVIRTPTFMPVGTRGSVKSVPMSMLDTISPDVVLANTYHLHLKPGEKVVKDLGGLHSFMNRAEPILTDSGGFQVFSLSGIRTISEEGVEFTDPTTGDRVFISPEDAIRIQIDLGADIIMAFDDLTGLGEGERSRTKEAFDRTHRWLERCLTEFKKLTADMEENERPL